MRWGGIECLRNITRILKINNTGLIPATMQVFLRLAHSKFSLKDETVSLLPGQTYDLEVTANLDDSLVVAEELHVMVEEGTCSQLYLHPGLHICYCVTYRHFVSLQYCSAVQRSALTTLNPLISLKPPYIHCIYRREHDG